MTGQESSPEDLALHGPRILGFASAARVAGRYGLAPAVVEELLLDDEAYGWVRRSEFAGTAGWSLTPAGRREDQRRMSAELDLVGGRALVLDVHERFLPANARLGQAMTDWQIRPERTDPLAANDHTDWAWDERVLHTLAALGRDLAGLADELAGRLRRFDRYAGLYAAALGRIDGGQRRYVDAPELDSCHTVWIQFHEDLIATLGIDRT